MATVALLIGGAILNAAAFTGGNAIYHALEGNQSNAEKIRHDKAVEALNKATAEWTESRLKNQDFMSRQRLQEARAKHELSKTDDALMSLPSQQTTIATPFTRPKPKLSDFYKPSEKQKGYEYTFIIGGLLITGYLSYKLI